MAPRTVSELSLDSNQPLFTGWVTDYVIKVIEVITWTGRPGDAKMSAEGKLLIGERGRGINNKTTTCKNPKGIIYF